MFLLPEGVVILLLLAGWWRRKWWPVAAALVILYVASTTVVSDRLIGWLESRYPAVAVAQVEGADATVVLGGILGPKSAPGKMVNWLETVERFEAGVALLQAGKSGSLVFTGARISWEPRETLEGEDLKRLAVARGVAPGKILVTTEISNTADEARAVAGLMKANGWKKIILVTTAWHMPRAARLFRAAGVEFTAFPVDYRTDPGRPLTLLDFLPRAEALWGTETALRECYGYAFYALTGR